jgi:hypothetical protein
MTLVRIAFPETEPQLAIMTSALESAGIPYFVHSANFGSLWPGLSINGYNARSIMVPEAASEEATRVLAELHFSHAEESSLPARGGRLRLLLETVLFGWFIPGRRPKALGDDT